MPPLLEGFSPHWWHRLAAIAWIYIIDTHTFTRTCSWETVEMLFTCFAPVCLVRPWQVLSCMLWAQNIRMNQRLSVFPWITFIQRGSGLLSVQLWIQSGFIQDIFWSRFFDHRRNNVIHVRSVWVWVLFWRSLLYHTVLWYWVHILYTYYVQKSHIDFFWQVLSHCWHYFSAELLVLLSTCFDRIFWLWWHG